MESKTITFDSMPDAVAYLIDKVENIETILSTGAERTAPPEEKQWMSLKELQSYHPDHPAPTTVYGWVRNNQIPFYKVGKKLSFKKSEIDAWLESSRMKTDEEFQRDAIEYINNKRLRR